MNISGPSEVIPLWPGGAAGSEDWNQQEQETLAPAPMRFRAIFTSLCVIGRVSVKMAYNIYSLTGPQAQAPTFDQTTVPIRPFAVWCGAK